MEIEVYAPALLLWLDQHACEKPGVYADIKNFAKEQTLPPTFVGTLVTVLQADGFITALGDSSSPRRSAECL